jgi:hypothetical protein
MGVIRHHQRRACSWRAGTVVVERARTTSVSVKNPAEAKPRASQSSSRESNRRRLTRGPIRQSSSFWMRTRVTRVRPWSTSVYPDAACLGSVDWMTYWAHIDWTAVAVSILVPWHRSHHLHLHVPAGAKGSRWQRGRRQPHPPTCACFEPSLTTGPHRR